VTDVKKRRYYSPLRAEQAHASREAVLRAARELERFGDLATNLAERVIYMVTGRFQEMNIDRGDLIG